MKIRETIERDCCDDRKGDIKPYNGIKHNWMLKTFFCRYCGQIWVEDTRADAACGTEKYLRKLLANDDGIIRE